MFLAKTLFFQSTLLSSVTVYSPCTPNVLAFKDLSLRKIKNKKKKNQLRREERNQIKAWEVTPSTPAVAGKHYSTDMGKAKEWSLPV